MADTLPGPLGPVILDGYLFDRAVETSRGVVWNPLSEINRMLPGGRARQASRYMGAGAPLAGGWYELTLQYDHIRGQYDTVLDVLAAPGEHEVVFWRRHALAYAGNGSRVEFTLPWPPALDPLGPWSLPPTLSGGTPAAALATEVKTGIGGTDANGDAVASTPFTVLSKVALDYAGGSPAAGEAWFHEDGTKFKVGTAPGTGEKLYCRIVPIITMFEQGRVEAQYKGATNKEPRNIVLVED